MSRARIFGIALAGAALSGCRGGDERHAPASAAVAVAPDAMRAYADIAYAGYSDAVDGARKLAAAVDRFLGGPSAATLADARRAWLSARIPYLQTEVFRFYDGPIDSVELLVNTWPIDENYVESGETGAPLGIVDDTTKYPELSARLLAELNAKDGETSITTGYHVIEYWLWGRDTRADGPGDRPYADFIVPKATRRAAYLRIAAGLLVDHLEGVRAAWAPGENGNYRSNFLRLEPRRALALVVKGMGSLAGPELGGERLTVPYETKDQENEHSCFSDNTHNDVVLDALGIQNVCLGRYERTDGAVVQGPGVCDWIAAVDSALAGRLRDDVAASVTAARAIPPPFDQAIAGADSDPGRSAVHRTIRSLETTTQTLSAVAALFDISLSLAPARRR